MSKTEIDLTSSPSGIYALAYSDHPTIAYNETHRSLDITGLSTNHKVVLASFPAISANSMMVVESDIELLSDPLGRRIVGIALIDPKSESGGYFSGPEVCSLDGGWRAMHRNAWMSYDAFYAYLTDSSVTYSVGARHVLRFVKSGQHYEFYVDGNLILSFEDAVFREAELIPAIIVYQCSIRVRSLKFNSVNLTDIKNVISVPSSHHRAIRMLSGSILERPVMSLYGGISGAVLRKGDPAPLQLSCFDSKMNLIDTVQADSHGLYRFDNLPLNDRYIIMSIDDARAEFQPYATDWKTPVPYA